MRKSAFLLSCVLGLSTLTQTTVFAETHSASEPAQKEVQQSAASNDEYNEFGIKKGTIVNGVDISKLSEKELQYVPKAWRDGTATERHEHPEEDPAPKLARSASYPNVNSYIKSKGFKAVKPKQDYKSQFPKFGYRYGKVEGVVAHETANNNSTIWNEISYMSRNYNNAFVHAFVDANNVIQIHPQQYAVWGAGPYANQRFYQVELVRHKTFDEFARSINNYAELLALVLYQNNLPVTTATASGGGTLWSHADVSKYLGGTTHGDPIGYFASYGYTWSQFVTLVKEKYQNLVENGVQQTGNVQEKTSKLGHIRNANNVIYKTAGKSAGSFKAGSTYTNQVYYIKQQARVNGTLYYKISTQPSASKGIVGWVKSSDMSVHAHTGVDKNKKVFYIKGNLNLYSKAWGGNKDLVYKGSDRMYDLFEVNLTEKVGNNVWYRGKIGGKTAWVHSSGVITPSGKFKEAKTSRLGHIRSENGEIYVSVEDERSSKRAGEKYTNAVYYIKKQAYHNGQHWYLLSNNPSATSGIVGWMKEQDLSTHLHHGTTRANDSLTIIGTGKAYSKAWGGSKDLVYDLSNYRNRSLPYNLIEKVGNNTWYRGVLDGKTVWIHSSYLRS